MKGKKHHAQFEWNRSLIKFSDFRISYRGGWRKPRRRNRLVWNCITAEKMDCDFVSCQLWWSWWFNTSWKWLITQDLENWENKIQEKGKDVPSRISRSDYSKFYSINHIREMIFNIWLRQQEENLNQFSFFQRPSPLLQKVFERTLLMWLISKSSWERWSL